ncbi:hypothetical protein [Streptomyces europaeiscabiei]|uniref:hypothetical protein n=1 Tax=Streptomyces europaeiscabiei TaxID=146819 RepID=UPI0029B39DB3|nr:hypothetical protein [Streptomyces europaeiscabiei]MDX2762279.1 hypothetical protein [Streptomyces europaeiscabiei]
MLRVTTTKYGSGVAGRSSPAGVESMLFDVYEHILDDVPNALCSLPYPMPSRLRDTVHLAYRTSVQLDAGLDLQHRM